MNPSTLEAKVNGYLAQERIAVARVSRNNSHPPTGNLIYRRSAITQQIVHDTWS